MIADEAASRSSADRIQQRRITGVAVGFAAMLAIAVWCTYYQRWPGLASFQVPISYADRGDALYTFGVTKAFSQFPAPWWLEIPSLNAPFGADWNDYPHTEKLVFYVCGLMRRLFDAGTTANLSLLLCHVASGVAFAWAARQLGANLLASVVGATAYAFNPFMIGRGLGHLNIAYVWHIPLILYLTHHVGTTILAPTPFVWAGTAALMAAMAWQNPYYTLLGFQLLLLATLRASLLKRGPAVRLGMFAILVGASAFALNQVNVFARSWRDGPNAVFSGRSLNAMLTWGLRLPDLFLPRHHPLGAWSDFAGKNYFEAGNPGTENGYAFLGVLGCLLLVGMVVHSLHRGLGGRPDEIPWMAWLAGYTTLFALAGGLNYFLGSLGMTWLRAANRYSIVILCCALLWGCQAIQGLRTRWIGLGIGAGALALPLLELFAMRPADFAARTAEISRMTSSDKRFVEELEKRLPSGASVFQLPVVGFPEAPTVNRMIDYEHFRPYVWSKALRFSYGTHKGREREEWQEHVARLEAGGMTRYLGEHGFEALVINRRGYKDSKNTIETALQRIAGPIAESADGDLVAYPVVKTGARLPEAYTTVALGKGFPWGWETDEERRWAWSNGSAHLRILRPLTIGKHYRISLSAETLVTRRLRIRVGSKELSSLKLVPGQTTVVTGDWVAESDDRRIALDTDSVAERPPNGDSRLLGFRILDPSIEERRDAHDH